MLPLATRAARFEFEDNFASSGDTLRALIDTLIPADDTPAASALGIDVALFDIAHRNSEYRRLITEGTIWLERSARALGAKTFAAATDSQRIAVVRAAERAPPYSLARILFERVRTDAMRLYYAHPRTWPVLGYSGPPQPAGFLDFERHPSMQR